MKTSRKSSSSDKKKLLAIPVLGIVFVAVLASTDWSVLSDSEDSTAQDLATTNVTATTESGGSAERVKDTTARDQSSANSKKLSSGKSSKIEDWSQVPHQSTIDLQPLGLDKILAYDPFLGGPTVVVSPVSPESEASSPSPDGSQVKPEDESLPEVRNVSAVYIEKGKAYAFIQGKVVPVEGHEQLIRRLNQSSAVRP